MHSNQFFHRDLKLENILIILNNYDFNSAKFIPLKHYHLFRKIIRLEKNSLWPIKNKNSRFWYS